MVKVLEGSETCGRCVMEPENRLIGLPALGMGSSCHSASQGETAQRKGSTDYTGLEAGFRNWVPKIGNCKISGRPNFEGGPRYTQITNINMYRY